MAVPRLVGLEKGPSSIVLVRHGESVGNLADWETYYGTPPPLAASSAAIPEPAGLLLAATGLFALVARRRA